MLYLKLHARASVWIQYLNCSSFWQDSLNLQNPVMLKIHLSDFCTGLTGEVNGDIVGMTTPASFQLFAGDTDLWNFPRNEVLLSVYYRKVRCSSSFYQAISSSIVHISLFEELIWVFCYVLNIHIFNIHSRTRKIITMSLTWSKTKLCLLISIKPKYAQCVSSYRGLVSIWNYVK